MTEIIEPVLPAVFLFYLLDMMASSPYLKTHTPVNVTIK